MLVLVQQHLPHRGQQHSDGRRRRRVVSPVSGASVKIEFRWKTLHFRIGNMRCLDKRECELSVHENTEGSVFAPSEDDNLLPCSDVDIIGEHGQHALE